MRITPLAHALALSALVVAAPSLAEGKKDRAREAVAAAQAKVDAANQVGATGDAPRLRAEAAAMLRTAQEDLAGDHKEKAIADANRAQELAEQAIGAAQQHQAARADAQVNAAAATSAAAQDQAAAAQADAAAANARAASAEQAAASAQADAAAARAAPPVVVTTPAPAPTTATVTTETSAPAVATTTTKRVVHRPARRVVHHTTVKPAVKTTTTVTTQ